LGPAAISDRAGDAWRPLRESLPAPNLRPTPCDPPEISMQFGFVLAAALAASIPAASASASSVTYTYQGQMFGFRDPVTNQWTPCTSDPDGPECWAVGPSGTWTGSLTLTDQYPARIRNSTLTLSIDNMDVSTGPCDYAYRKICYSYQIAAENGAVYAGHSTGGWGALGIISYSGFLYEFLEWSEVYGLFTFTFGNRGQITSWYGRTYLYLSGRAYMPTSIGGRPGANDSNQHGSYTLGQGTWSGSVLPQPVPAPPAAALLATALGGAGIIGAARRRRQAVV